MAAVHEIVDDRYLAAPPCSPHLVEPTPSSEILPPERFLLPIEQYQGLEPRVSGLQELIEVQKEVANTLPIQTPPQLAVTSPELFAIYQQCGYIPDEIKEVLRSPIEQMLETSATGSLAVRRSFYVPGEREPRGRTFNDLRSADQIIDGIEEQFFDAISMGYTQIPGSEIAAFIQEWADPEFKGPITAETRIGAGGEAFIRRVAADGTLIITVRACLGENASMQVAPELVDSWQVVYRPNGSLSIEQRKVVPKPVFILQRVNPPEGLEAKPHSTPGFWQVPLPPGLVQQQPALPDIDVYRAANVVRMLYRLRGPRRVECSLGLYPTSESQEPQYGLVFNQSLPKEIEPEPEHRKIEIAAGKVAAVIKDQGGVDYIHLVYGHQGKKPKLIVFIDPKLATRRDAEADKTLRTLLKYKGTLVILIPCLDTEHNIRELASPYPQHQVIPVGTQVIEEKHQVRVIQEDGQYRVINETLTGEAGTLISLEEALRQGLTDPKVIGGKAVGCCQLMALGYHVPFSFALTNEFADEVLRVNDLDPDQVRQGISQATNKQDLIALFEQTASRIQRLPKRAWERARATLLANATARAKDGQEITFAVRSNASYEDRDPQSPFAGIGSSTLNVPTEGKALHKAVLGTFRSAWSRKVATRLWDRGIKDPTVPVLIQGMVKGEVSGTVFGQEITGARREEIIVIQAQLGEHGVVDGQTDRPTITIRFNTQTESFELIAIKFPERETPILLTEEQFLNHERQGTPRQQIILKHGEVQELIVTTRRLGENLGRPQDTEWVIGPEATSPYRRIQYVQTRPL